MRMLGLEGEKRREGIGEEEEGNNASSERISVIKRNL